MACNGDEQPGARDSGTQASSREPAGASPQYRLTDPVVRKVAAVMREWDPKGPPPSSADQAEQAAYFGKQTDAAVWVGKAANTSVAERTAEFDRIPELKAAIARAGLSTPEFAEAWLAYVSAKQYLMEEDAARKTGDDPPTPLPPGVLKDNVELIRQMEREETLPDW
jgi:hypothetical protein